MIVPIFGLKRTLCSRSRGYDKVLYYCFWLLHETKQVHRCFANCLKIIESRFDQSSYEFLPRLHNIKAIMPDAWLTKIELGHIRW